MKLSQIIQAWENGETIQEFDDEGNLLSTWDKLRFNEDAPIDIRSKASVKNIRIKPRTLSINGVEFPEPCRTEPAYNQEYWIPAASNDTQAISLFWTGCYFDIHFFRNGFVHLTSEAAAKHCHAMCEVTRKKD